MRFVSVVFLVGFCLLGSFGPADAQPSHESRVTPALVTDAHEWLRSLLPETAGACDFTFALFTGNLTTDPDYAEAQRRLLVVWLNTTVRPGDTVRIAAAERTVWQLMEPLTMDGGTEVRRRLFSALPSHPAPGSRGGKDVEAVLKQLSREVKPREGRTAVFVMLSNSWSQVGRTTGSRGTASEAPDPASAADGSRDNLHREVFDVPSFSGLRQVYATAMVKPPTNPGPGSRSYPKDWNDWVPRAYAPAASALTPTTATPPDKPLREGGSPWLGILIGGVALFASGFGIARLASLRNNGTAPRAMKPSEEASVPALEDASRPALPEPPDHLPDLTSAIQVAQEHASALAELQASLRDVADRLAETARLAASGTPASQVEVNNLRTEMAALQESLRNWDQTAIAYLEAAEEVVRNPAMDERHRRAWKKAADDFCRMAERHGFRRIDPRRGEPFVPGLHQAVDVIGDPARATVVDECLRWGYANGPDVYRLAEVRVVEPSTLSGTGD